MHIKGCTAVKTCTYIMCVAFHNRAQEICTELMGIFVMGILLIGFFFLKSECALLFSWCKENFSNFTGLLTQGISLLSFYEGLIG